MEIVAVWAPVPRWVSHHKKRRGRSAAGRLYGYRTYSGRGGRFRASHDVYRNCGCRSRHRPQEDARQDPRRVRHDREVGGIAPSIVVISEFGHALIVELTISA